jgi:hypothetical protein
MAQTGPSDYRTREPMSGGQERIMDQMHEAASGIGERSLDLAEDLGAAIKERPYTTLAIAAGLAFALGALWKLGQRRPQSRLESLWARMPELPNRTNLLPPRWR